LSGGFGRLLAFVQLTVGVSLDKIGDLMKNVGVLVHLIFQRRILFADILEKTGGVAEKAGGEFSVTWHGLSNLAVIFDKYSGAIRNRT